MTVSPSLFRTVPLAGLMLLLSMAATAPSVDGSESGAIALEASGGSLVLLEQVTATWCDVCATHEQWLDDFDAANPTRVQRVALHSIVDDPLGNPASEVRLGALAGSDEGRVPLYHFDGTKEMLTSQSASNLQSSLLAAESDRIEFEAIAVSARESAGVLVLEVSIEEPIAVNGTVVTVLLLERLAHLEPSLATNGVTEHPNLLRQSASIPLDGGSPEFAGFATGDANANMSVSGSVAASFELVPGWGSIEERVIVVVHEHAVAPPDGPRTLAALSLSTSAVGSGSSPAPWLVIAVAGLLVAGGVRMRSRASA